MNEPRILEMAVIYDHPRDYPHHFVVRIHSVLANGDTEPDPHPIAITESLELARAAAAERFCWPIPEPEGGDPHILETWL